MYTVLTGKVTNMDWPDEDTTYTDTDGNSYVEEISIYGDDCLGHRGSDVFPYGLLKNDLNDFKVHTGIKGNIQGGNILTNRELLEVFDPRVNRLSYVYDTFKWTHCELDGYNMDDAWHTPTSKKAQHESAGDGVLGSDSGDSERKSAIMSPGRRPVSTADEPRYPKYSELTETD